jgi:hypothetical protein
MSTLIAFYNSAGLVGRCDAKCDQAHEPDCHYICGGSNHGVGLYRALTNTQAYARAWAELPAAAAGASTGPISVRPSCSPRCSRPLPSHRPPSQPQQPRMAVHIEEEYRREQQITTTAKYRPRPPRR